LLIGYKYSHAFTFGQESTLTKDVDHTGTSKLLMLAKIQPLSGGNSTDPFFLEFSYTGGKDSFNDGTFAITITKAFDTMW
jgi:hypothetical protein